MMKRLEHSVMKTWWVILFLLLCIGLYEQGAHVNRKDLACLTKELQNLDRAEARLMKKQEELRLQLDSQSDPDWIRLALMKGLGLVPDGTTKVYFSPKVNH